MTGQKLYDIYAREMAKLPHNVTRGEALPAWDFIQEELRDAWSAVASQLTTKR